MAVEKESVDEHFKETINNKNNDLSGHIKQKNTYKHFDNYTFLFVVFFYAFLFSLVAYFIVVFFRVRKYKMQMKKNIHAQHFELLDVFLFFSFYKITAKKIEETSKTSMSCI